MLGERKLKKKDGTEIPVEINSKLLDNGKYQSIIRDITERKKSEEAIQLSYRRLKEAELIGKTGYWHLDVKTGKVTWSEGTYWIFGETSRKF